MARVSLQWLVVGMVILSAGCWGRSVWADYDGGLNVNQAEGCGNDRLEGNEECDGENLAGYTCRILGLGEGTLACSSNCTFNLNSCGGSEDCGNGIVDANEDCDGVNLNNQFCWTLGFAGGTLSCTNACRFETNQCTPFEGCGNGIIEFGEECDDGNTASGDGCSSTCQIETPQCGNGVLQPGQGEECDGADLGGTTCQDLCYAGGTLACSAICTFDVGDCFGGPPCGDGVAECGEDCDGADLQGATCQSLGFTGGSLGCDAGCGFDTSACSGQAHYLLENFESTSLPGWILTGDWEVGVPGSFADEPQAYEGQRVLGTRIGNNYSDNRQYLSNMAQSPLINLNSAVAPVLRFMGWISAEDYWDGANVWVRPQGTSVWTHLDNPSVPYLNTVGGYPAWTGVSLTSWVAVEIDLSSYVGQVIQIAFAMHTDGSVTQTGAYVDQVLVTETGEVPVSITSVEDLGIAMATEAFSTQLSATGGSGAFAWSRQPGGINDSWLSVSPTTGVLSGTPAETNAGPVEVVVRAASQSNPGNYDEVRFYLEVQRQIWADTLDAGAVGWTLSGDWEWGTPSNVGPSSCQSGSCVGLQMASEYHNNQQWTFCTATSPPIDLTTAVSPTLRFWSYVDTEGASWDGGNLKISTGGPAFNIATNVDPPYNLNNVQGQQAWGGNSMTGGWQQFEADLSAYAGQTIRVQFAFRSDGSVTRAGWYVDELVILDF